MSEPKKEEGMDKYAVVLDDTKTKTAGEGTNCPTCGKQLTRDGYCPKCGTEPFEKRPEPKK